MVGIKSWNNLFRDYSVIFISHWGWDDNNPRITHFEIINHEITCSWPNEPLYSYMSKTGASSKAIERGFEPY